MYYMIWISMYDRYYLDIELQDCNASVVQFFVIWITYLDLFGELLINLVLGRNKHIWRKGLSSV